MDHTAEEKVVEAPKEVPPAEETKPPTKRKREEEAEVPAATAMPGKKVPVRKEKNLGETKEKKEKTDKPGDKEKRKKARTDEPSD